MTLLVIINKKLAGWIAGEEAELSSLISKVIISQILGMGENQCLVKML
jgi:hypothetical protein